MIRCVGLAKRGYKSRLEFTINPVSNCHTCENHSKMDFRTLVIALALVASAYSQCPPDGRRCDLPNCLCPSLDVPGGLQPQNIPQIVMLSFDDAVQSTNMPYYEDLILPRKNKNGHPISATFFVTHEYTNYTAIHELWRKGHEIAIHTVTHKTDSINYWKVLNTSMWEFEVADQRGMVAHFAKIDKSDVIGFRAAFLQGGGDVMMNVLAEEGFKYDCSRPTRQYVDPALWPYTADYNQRFQDCQIEPCPVNPYPGFWIIPMVDYTGDDGEPCAMLDQCQPVPETRQAAFNLIQRNFLRHYNRNKAPFGVYLHSAWFVNPEDPHGVERYEGYRMFLNYLETLTDVYIVSAARALEWVKRPTNLTMIDSFTPWHHTDKDSTCLVNSNCRFRPEDTPFNQERYMMSCQTCPRKYPWIKNPYGLDNGQ